VTIIINYCAAITAMLESQITTNPHLVVLCMTDNISAKDWTMHTSKKSIIWHASARFFLQTLDWLIHWHKWEMDQHTR
jgi:hypothetical protein